MEDYLKQEYERILNSELIIHWWNFGKKTLNFKGTVLEWCNKFDVFYSINEEDEIEVEFSVGSLKTTLLHRDLETMIRMIISIYLSYMGDSSEFSLLGRIKTFNK